MRYSIAFAVVALTAIALGLPASVHAIDKCQVKVDKKTGVIRVDAKGLGGPILWGEAFGQENNAFFNDATCVSGATAKKCELFDPATLAAATPPEECRIYLDDGVAPCDVWIRGCVPGPRTDTNGPLTCQDVTVNQIVPNGGAFTLTPNCPGGTTLTGGGHDFTGFTTGLWWWQSGPFGNAWRCRGTNQSGALSANVTCYARCCSVP